MLSSYPLVFSSPQAPCGLCIELHRYNMVNPLWRPYNYMDLGVDSSQLSLRLFDNRKLRMKPHHPNQLQSSGQRGHEEFWGLFYRETIVGNARILHKAFLTVFYSALVSYPLILVSLIRFRTQGGFQGMAPWFGPGSWEH